MEQYKFHKIVARHSGSVLDVRGASHDDCAEVIQYHENNQDNQRFAFFPQDDNCFIIAAKHSGKVLDIKGGSMNDWAPLIQYTCHGGNNQRFYPIDLNANWTPIQAKHSAKNLDVQGASKNDSVNIIQYHSNGGDNQKFIIQAMENMNVPQQSNIEKLGDIPRLKGFDQQLPEQTQPVITSQTFLPYFCADDSISAEQRIKTTPYYKLTKRQYWRKLYQEEFSGKTQETRTESYHVGMTETARHSMETRTNMSLQADLGFSFKGLTAGISSRIERELKVTESHEEQVIQEKTITVEITMPKGERFTIAEWIRVDEYILERANGIQIGNWEVSIEEDTRQDSFPKEGVKMLQMRILEPSEVR